MNSYFYLQIDKNQHNAQYIDALEKYSHDKKKLVYVLNGPLGDSKYQYNYSKGVIVLSPGHKVAIIDLETGGEDFQNYVEDLLEDIASISDKYTYKEALNRPRYWRSSLVDSQKKNVDLLDIDSFFSSIKLENDTEIKKVDLIISLLIGSINDIDRVKDSVPMEILDKVKQKIQLFDGDQTRFIYQNIDKRRIKIQGLSGTGKTELLLHKLKDLYVNDVNSTIFFTCWNKILADNLKKRIPSFFDFMKVEKQIEWQKRLWCESAWGSNANINSGAYRYICSFYQIPFNRYSYTMPFERACKLAIADIKTRFAEEKIPFAFTYMFVDESQDFNDSFFDLCDLITEKRVFVAGDIFQSIFDPNINDLIEPDFLLGKCYRTDPKTLMFAHALGMGLFEKEKLRWLEKNEWKGCGYQLVTNGNKYLLSREPLRRFEDLDDDFASINLIENSADVSDTVLNIISRIRNENRTVTPDDIGVIFLDSGNGIYKISDIISAKIESKFKWKTNKTYETKEKIENTLLLSNRNNVKGLEFPFVICITQRIINTYSYRNALYTMLTRSFIQSFLIINQNDTTSPLNEIKIGLDEIITKKQMTITEPSEKEKIKIQTRFKINSRNLSPYDRIINTLDQLKIENEYRNALVENSKGFPIEDMDDKKLADFIRDTYKYLKK